MLERLTERRAWRSRRRRLLLLGLLVLSFGGPGSAVGLLGDRIGGDGEGTTTSAAAPVPAARNAQSNANAPAAPTEAHGHTRAAHTAKAAGTGEASVVGSTILAVKAPARTTPTRPVPRTVQGAVARPREAASAAGFSIASTAHTSVYREFAAVYAIDVQPSNGFTGSVALSVVGLPAGTTAVFTTSSIARGSGNSSLIVQTSATTPVGTHLLTIRGIGRSPSRIVRAKATLAVAPPPARHFTFTVSWLRSTADTVTYRIEVQRVGVAGPITFSIESSLPAGVKATFDPATTSGNSTTLTLTGIGSVPNGLPLAIRGASRGRLEVTAFLTVKGRPVAISGNARGLLYPGGAPSPIDLDFANPNGVAVQITSLTVSIASVTAPNTTAQLRCTAADFEVRQFSGSYPFAIPAGSSSLSRVVASSTAWPSVRMLNTARNQDGCKGATVNLAYTWRDRS